MRFANFVKKSNDGILNLTSIYQKDMFNFYLVVGLFMYNNLILIHWLSIIGMTLKYITSKEDCILYSEINFKHVFII